MSHYVGVRDVVRVSGEDAEAYLQGQISQDVLGLAAGTSAWSLILQPQGKVDAWFRVTRTGDDSFLLDVDAGFGETLLARLKRFKLRTKADLALEEWAWAYTGAHEDETGELLVVAPSVIGSGVDVLAPELPNAIDADSSMDASAYELLRIRAGVPAMGSELGENTIPAEAGIVDRSVSFTKGCYTGQELVARVDSRGNNTPRKLRIVTGAGLPAAGAVLSSDGADAGALTSVAANGDGFVALAYVKRSAFEAQSLQLDSQAVDVSPVPGAG